jgi:SAM-dependent MidA family methyltransferase
MATQPGPATPELLTAIGDGAIGFDEFMEIALYGTAGFYTAGSVADTGEVGVSGGRAGRRGGDFLTSPEVGPLFGAVIARFLDAEWRRLGEPPGFTVVDAGAGPGTLLRTILAAQPACMAATRWIAVEISAGQRAGHSDQVESMVEMPAGPFVGVILANELLDNLPIRLAVFDQGWREAFVTVDAHSGGCMEILSAPFEPPPRGLPAQARHGARAPIQTRAEQWVHDARSRLSAGRVVAFDYASASTAAMADRPFRDWLRTYRGHERGQHPLQMPGSQDITCEVALDQLPVPDALRTQQQWLELWGIEELVEQGRQIWTERAARPDLEAIKMRSRISEAEALCDPSGLGAFIVAEWTA